MSKRFFKAESKPAKVRDKRFSEQVQYKCEGLPLNYGTAMKIYDQDEADCFFKLLVDSVQEKNPEMPRFEVERIQRENLGYFAGYYDRETRRRVERLFHTSHPILGPIAAGEPTLAEAFKMGQEWAKYHQLQKKERT